MCSHNIKIKYLFNVKSENMEYSHKLQRQNQMPTVQTRLGFSWGFFRDLGHPLVPHLTAEDYHIGISKTTRVPCLTLASLSHPPRSFHVSQTIATRVTLIRKFGFQKCAFLYMNTWRYSFNISLNKHYS